MSKSEKEQYELEELKRTFALKMQSALLRADGISAHRHKLTKEMIELTEEYVNLYSDESNLDGYFSATELRTIANKMDELKVMESKEEGERHSLP